MDNTVTGPILMIGDVRVALDRVPSGFNVYVSDGSGHRKVGNITAKLNGTYVAVADRNRPSGPERKTLAEAAADLTVRKTWLMAMAQQAAARAILVGTCYDCDKPVTALDRFIVCWEDDGAYVIHKSCVGCDDGDEDCGGCGSVTP